MSCTYKHTTIQKDQLNLPAGKVICVGLNYNLHIKEMQNNKQTEPVLFIKPTTSIRSSIDNIKLPRTLGPCYYETELTILITSKLSSINEKDIENHQFYYGVGLDLTLREIQSELKQKGLPWEKSKAFDNSCILSPWLSEKSLDEIQKSIISFTIGNEVKQHESASEMLTDIKALIAHASKYFTLMPGDVLMTGTPHGVGLLSPGDTVTMSINEHQFNMNVT